MTATKLTGLHPILFLKGNPKRYVPAYGGYCAFGTFSAYDSITQWAQIFFFARIAHAIVYTLGIPYLRTPVYLILWLAVLMIGTKII